MLTRKQLRLRFRLVEAASDRILCFRINYHNFLRQTGQPSHKKGVNNDDQAESFKNIADEIIAAVEAAVEHNEQQVDSVFSQEEGRKGGASDDGKWFGRRVRRRRRVAEVDHDGG